MSPLPTKDDGEVFLDPVEYDGDLFRMHFIKPCSSDAPQINERVAPASQINPDFPKMVTKPIPPDVD
jgi:hypothetical protein